MTELELVHKAKAGDRAAMAELLVAYATQAYRVALHILGNEADAEDASQNAFVKAITQLERFEERSAFGTWLLRIVTREALNLRRAQKTRFAFWQRHAQSEESEATLESTVQVRAEHQELWRAVNRLKTDDRMVLTLSYYMGMSEADMAVTLGIRRGAVKKRKHSALVRLRTLVEREFPGLRVETLGGSAPEGISR